MKTVLFAWELGSGSGHVMSIRRLASRLVARGIRVVAAVTSLESISVLDGVVSEIHRMPNWRYVNADPRAGDVPSSATLNDVLVSVGFAERAFVQRMIEAWQRLFRTINPSLVVADFAPAAALAARHRIPLVMIGTGYTLPPHEMPAFPPLHEFHPPVHREEDTLAAINAAARELGLDTLDRLPQLFAGDAHLLLHTLPLLDPYAGHRVTAAYGLLIDYVPRAPRPGAQQVFVYLSPGVEVRGDVVAALRPIARHVRMYAPMLPEDARIDLAHRGARIEPEPIDLAQALGESRLVVHLGGTGLVSEAVLAGTPQYLLVMHIEQHLSGMILERAGAGRLFAAYDPAQTLPVNALEMVLHDKAIARHAAELGVLQRQGFASGAAFAAFDDACARLLP